MEDPKPPKLVPRYCSYCGTQMVEEQVPASDPAYDTTTGKRLPPQILWVCPKYDDERDDDHDHIVRDRPLPPRRS